MNNTPKTHCPGFERFRDLKSFVCKCPSCGTEVEIFSDEFDKERHCRVCERQIDFSRCEFSGGGTDPSPR